MKLLAAFFALTLAAVPVAFAQELEEAPGAAPMDTAAPPSADELNGAVDQLSKEKTTAPAPHGGTRGRTAPPAAKSAPKPSPKTAKHSKMPASTGKAKKAAKKVVKKAAKKAGKAKSKKKK